MPDDLDRMAATTIVSVIVWPLLDGSEMYGIKVDAPKHMDPFSARGVLIGGAEYLESLTSWQQEEETDEE